MMPNEIFPGHKAHGECYRAFHEEMRFKQYGQEESSTAWLWFLAGWLAKAKHEKQNRLPC